ncbi:Esterase FE4 [Eumeta japonica]|uniref:Esterase FE4 n=1 Tax=Eumeta variegata TaxID=151549 RepID=A0A4C1V7G9_EUMVA|nr:Esterase FE4 [Eumeta japonica]
MKTCILVLLMCHISLCTGGQHLDVTIDQGTVRGYKHATRAVYAFHGIPYATIPTGKNKFKSSLPPPKFAGVFEAIEDAVLCPQLSNDLNYREDCLVVNVFVPEKVQLLPKSVLVMIHGGGFAVGFGNMLLPYNIVEKDVIVVTFNYRVGVHGFLCLNSENVPGNAGLRDQINALKWLKNNIAAFGGDPKDITLSGFNAGAASAELLLLSPAAKNLFDKIILESGSAAATWAVNPKSVDFARTVAIRNGATDVDDLLQLEEYYTSLSYPELIALTRSDGRHMEFVPCVDNGAAGEEIVLGAMPQVILQNGNYTKLPLLTGYTDAEGLIYYPERKRIMIEMDTNFKNHLPLNFNPYAYIEEADAIQLIKRFYFENTRVIENSIKNYTDYFSDSYFIYWIIESAKQHALNSVPVYLYQFSYVPSTQRLKGLGLGAGHCTQAFLIHDHYLTDDEARTENDLRVQRRLIRMWTNFIKMREPMSPHQTDYWEPLDVERMNYMTIDLNLQRKNFPLVERMLFWDQIMKENNETDVASGVHVYLGLFMLSSVVLIIRHNNRSPALNPDLDTARNSDSDHDLDSNFVPTLDFDFGLVLISIPVSTFDGVSVSVLFVLLVCGQQRIVTIAQGQVRGHLARDIYTFHGIPYATAPTGNQKFKGPLPAPSWDGVFDAIDNIIICPQNSFIIGPLPYTENCLIVNVYVPDTNSTSKPVLVVVHGGAFAYGFGNSGIPYNLVDRDIIVVTFNYRVGVHGFLCLNTENVPGNAGLKDQITALRWIKNNIEAFGGNPHDITLSGYSAGAGAAELLMLSPAATDLFHKVILESGSALNTWAVNPDGLEYARKVAAQNGATNINNVEQLEEYYTRLSYPELVTLVGNDQLFSFLPCLENTSENDAVITTMPEDVLRSGNYTKLPLLTGYTDAEGLLYYNERETRMTEMNENFSSQLPPNFDFYSVLKEYEAIDLIKSFYFDEEVITENSIRNYTDYFTDSIFSYGIVESSRLHALNGAPTYLYEFSYVVSTDELRDTGLGANHCAQTYLIFTNVETGPNGTHTETDAVVQRRLLDMWSNFIKVKEPMSPEQSNYWESLDVERMNYLVINTELENRSFPIPERMRLWEEVMQEGDDSDAACAIHFHIGLLFLSYIILIRSLS